MNVAEREIIAAASLILQHIEGRRRDKYSPTARLSWRVLDELADAFRRAGLDAPSNVGADAYRRERDAVERMRARVRNRAREEVDRRRLREQEA